MCQRCENLRQGFLKLGWTDDQIMDYFWEHTPWPIGDPDFESIEKEFNLTSKIN